MDNLNLKNDEENKDEYIELLYFLKINNIKGFDVLQDCMNKAINLYESYKLKYFYNRNILNIIISLSIVSFILNINFYVYKINMGNIILFNSLSYLLIAFIGVKIKK